VRRLEDLADRSAEHGGTIVLFNPPCKRWSILNTRDDPLSANGMDRLLPPRG
jgi:hypothetical protein